MRWEVVVNTAQSVCKALALETRFNLSFWDALILHAAMSSDAAILYSEDFSNGQTYDAIRLVNPLIEPLPKQFRPQNPIRVNRASLRRLHAHLGVHSDRLRRGNVLQQGLGAFRVFGV